MENDTGIAVLAKFVLITHLVGSMVSFGIMLLRYWRNKNYTHIGICIRLLIIACIVGWLYTIDMICYWYKEKTQ